MAYTPAAEVEALVMIYANRADTCLVEAEAAAIEGNMQKSAYLREVANEWTALILAITGQTRPADE